MENKSEPDGNEIGHVLIVGGGTAGWMTAAAMARVLGPTGLRISLVESDDIGTVGVGEATIPPIHIFNAMLGIDENEFVAATAGTFKLGIEFDGWDERGTSYIHPFGDYGRDVDGVRFYQLWLRRRVAAQLPSIDAYNLSAMAARQNKFMRPPSDPKQFPSGLLAYAFHFDATLYAKFLRAYAEQRGVTRHEGRVVAVERHAQDGDIAAITLADGTCLGADFFIDCTGFRGLLIEEVLRAGYDDWSHWLPCDRAVAVPTVSIRPPRPYTRSIARSAGWQWAIPLQHRVGNGYVWSSAFTDEATATQALLDNVDGAPIAAPRQLRFVPGRRRAAWKANCVAIGLSAGFLEPLESTSIHLIQAGISKLLALFPHHRACAVQRDTYNRLTALQFDQVRDFVILHYHATRRDEALWQYVRNMPLPDALTARIELFRASGRLFRFEDELFGEANWLSVFLGQNIWPLRWDRAADAIATDKIDQLCHRFQGDIARAAQHMPPHQDFIDRYCRTDILA